MDFVHAEAFRLANKKQAGYVQKITGRAPHFYDPKKNLKPKSPWKSIKRQSPIMDVKKEGGLPLFFYVHEGGEAHKHIRKDETQ